MAASVIDAQNLYLVDLLPGSPLQNLSTPYGSFVHSSHFGVDEDDATYKLGTKIQKYDEVAKGFVTFIYLKAAAGASIAKLDIVLPASAADPTVVIECDGSGAIAGLGGAIAIKALPAGKCGWFWCDGPAPIGITAGTEYGTDGIDATDGILTDGTVAIGAVMHTAAGLSVQTAGNAIAALATVADDA